MKALIIVDMQNDFMPGGALAVPHADELIPIINRLIPHFSLVIATQDWHPSDHSSFVTLWPIHCVQHTPGAELVQGLNKEQIASIFHKGSDKEIDSYSAFFDNAHRKSTGLGEYLKSHHVDEVFFAGVATDYCVLYSVLDALQLGLKVRVVFDACRAINQCPGDEEKALAQMVSAGAEIVHSNDL